MGPVKAENNIYAPVVSVKLSEKATIATFQKMISDSLFKTDMTGKFFLSVVATLIVGFIPTYALGKIATGNNVIKVFVAATILQKIVSYISGVISGNTFAAIQKVFVKQAYRKYASLDFHSKNQESITSFRRKMQDASFAIAAVSEWGVTTVTDLLTTIIGTIWIFYNEGLGLLLIGIIISNFIVYATIIRSIQHTYTKLRMENVKNRQKSRAQIDCKLPWLEAGTYSPDGIIDLEKALISSNIRMGNIWKKISFVTNFTNTLPLIFLAFDSDPKTFLLMIKVFGSFTSSVRSFMGFINQLQTYKIKIDTYLAIWKDKKFAPQMHQYDLPCTLKITNIDINQGGFKVTGEPLSITQGQKILIKGESGHGKSTFINALIGKIKGITLDFLNPGNYFNQVAEFYQNIKEKMPTGPITIRQLFNGEMDDHLITECLQLTCSLKWANSLKPVPKKPEISFTTFMEFVKESCSRKAGGNRYVRVNTDLEANDRQNKFDIEINNRHSGGEKTRLAIATRIHQLIKSDKKMLILDEPEQGSDPRVGYKIIENIIARFPDVTIITISHLEKIQERFHWNMLLHVNNGVVRQVDHYE